MMEPAKDRLCDNIAEPLDRARAGGILPQRKVGAHLVIIVGVLRQNAFEGLFLELIACAEAGIVGFVTRDASVDDLVDAIRNALRGEVICSARVSGLLFQRMAALSGATQAPSNMRLLTRRECEIAKLVYEGMSNKEIARSLRIASATVKNHVHNILEKLQVSRRSAAAAILRRAASGKRRTILADHDPDLGVMRN
jgi:DNA-binding CsgD family transcriptional regulator